jgi:hypothetical protein
VARTSDERSIRKKTVDNELMKQYIVYDASDRPEYIYKAPVDAGTGDACILTRLAYAGITQRVVYKKEIAATWDTAWEAF